MADPDSQRAEIADRWERSAHGWETRADRVAKLGMPVSAWMIDRLGLQPGARVLELAAGPGDTGFMAAELVRPGGTVISSDASEQMLAVARARAEGLGVSNVEFLRLELEWIDLETASVDGILCRWGLMFAVDQGAAIREMRRVLRPGGRLALSTWAGPELNPWATIPTEALVELGHAKPPDPTVPGMFAVSDHARLRTLLEDGGFVEIVLDDLDLERTTENTRTYIDETRDLSLAFAEVLERLSVEEREAVVERISLLAEPFVQPDGLRFPGCALVAAASA